MAAISKDVKALAQQPWFPKLMRELGYEPKRKTGRWIYEGKRGRFPVCRCSECGNVENADWAMLGDNVNYCPNCGARMDGERDDV